MLANLPEDVFEHILNKLPIPSILSARAVCKSWKDKLDSSGFQKLYDLNCRTEEKQWLVVAIHKGEGTLICMHNKSFDRWFQVPFTWSGKWKVWGGAGGLLLAWSFSQGNRFVVGNPVSNGWKLLPAVPPLQGCFLSMGMANGADASSYKLVVLVYNCEDLSVTPVVYDSQLGLWAVKKKESTIATIRWPGFMPFVGCNGLLYTKRGNFFKYNAELDELTCVRLVKSPAIGPLWIVPWKGNFYMFAKLRGIEEQQLGVWVLGTDEWVLLSKSPLKMTAHDCCVWLDGDIVKFFGSRSSSTFTYNLAVADSWSTIQTACPPPLDLKPVSSVSMPLSFTAAP